MFFNVMLIKSIFIHQKTAMIFSAVPQEMGQLFYIGAEGRFVPD